MDAVADALESPELRLGVVFGLVVVVVLVAPFGRRFAALWVGLAVAAAVLVGLDGEGLAAGGFVITAAAAATGWTIVGVAGVLGMGLSTAPAWATVLVIAAGIVA